MVAIDRVDVFCTPLWGHVMPLFICATPIGNLADITFRVIECLRDSDLILCEDTRHTRKLLSHYNIQSELIRFDQHRESESVVKVLGFLEGGKKIALVSDAGIPTLNDPGRKIIFSAREAGFEVTVLPGSSAVTTALAASGMTEERFTFVGFLPRRENERIKLWQETKSWSWPVVAFESSKRLPASLSSLSAFDPDRHVVVCRELTKLHEDIRGGSAKELSCQFSVPPKGEVTLVIGGAKDALSSQSDRVKACTSVSELVSLGVGRRRAAKIISELTGIALNDLYRDSLPESTNE